MTRQIFSHESHHLGDQMIHLHLLRALAKQHQDTFFMHFCHACHHENLREVIADLPNILLASFESSLWGERKHESVGVWKNEGATDTRLGEVENYQRGFWENSPNRWEWSSFMLTLHEWNARRMGFRSPFKVREHLLFDYPACSEAKVNLQQDSFLIGDSPPSSGQYPEWADHSRNPLAPLIDALKKAGKLVWQTSELKTLGTTVSGIARASQNFQNLVMVANAPFFATLNTTNHHHHEGRRRIVLLDNGENLNMPNIEQVPNIEAVLRIAKSEGWI